MHQIPAKSHFPFCLLFPSSYSTQGRESQKVTENSTIYIYISKKNRKMGVATPLPKGWLPPIFYSYFFLLFFFKKNKNKNKNKNENKNIILLFVVFNF